MTGFLLDTCAISEMTKPRPNRGLVAWLDVVEPVSTFLSVFTIAEVRRGIERLASNERRALLETWFSSDIARAFSGRVLSFDFETAYRWGSTMAVLGKRGVVVPAVDSMIAVTALQSNLSVVTRNAGHFEALGVSVVNPWSS